MLCTALVLLACATAPAMAARPAAPAYDLYFGDLHAHTGYSDGASGTTPWDAFPAAIAAGADFMALTEHYSTSNAYEAWTMDETEWADLKDAAAFFTSSSFVAMPAYEYYLVSHTGEINVFNVSELPPKQVFLGPTRLGMFYDWLAQQPGGVGQFNHPTYVTDDFKDFNQLQRDARRGHGTARGLQRRRHREQLRQGSRRGLARDAVGQFRHALRRLDLGPRHADRAARRGA